jgi:beta-phosphoglucomutase family hydrolase
MKIQVNPQAKGLIFDLDGTLVDSIRIHYEAYMKVLAPYNIRFDISYMFTFTGMPSLECSTIIIRDLNVPMTPRELMDKKEQLFMQSVDKIELIEPVMQIVRHYKGKLPMGIATGSERIVAEDIIKRTGLDKYMDAVVTSDDVTHPKPHPETFEKCAQLLGVNPNECMAFEDGEHGMVAARKAGMWVVDVKPYYEKPVWN